MICEVGFGLHDEEGAVLFPTNKVDLEVGRGNYLETSPGQTWGH